MKQFIISLLCIASFSPYTETLPSEYYYELDSNTEEHYNPEDPSPSGYEEINLYHQDVNFYDRNNRLVFDYYHTDVIDVYCHKDTEQNELYYKVTIMSVTRVQIEGIYQNNSSLNFNNVITYPSTSENQFSIENTYYSYFNSKEGYKYTIPNYENDTILRVHDEIDAFIEINYPLYDRYLQWDGYFMDVIQDPLGNSGITAKIKQNSPQVQSLNNPANHQVVTHTGYCFYSMASTQLIATRQLSDYSYVYIDPEDFLPYSLNNGDIESYIETINPQIEVVDIPGLMFTILGMPFAWISTAFNLTLFPGTIYEVNIANIFFMIIGALVLMWIIKKLVK